MHVKNSKNFIFYEYNKNELLLLQKTIENSLNLILEERYGLVSCSLKSYNIIIHFIYFLIEMNYYE
jgi:hypothetical protein